MAGRRKGRVRRPAGEELELEVERLVNGPGAMARAPDGRVVFLDEGLPGERVRAQVESERKGFLRARVVRTLDPPAQARRAPPCPVVALCGGCPWQALEYESQVEAKQDVVLREVERACGSPPQAMLEPIVGPQWRARHRIRLAVMRHSDAEPAIGYRARGAHEVVPIGDCAIAREELVAALPLARLLARQQKAIREIELSIDGRAQLRLRGVCSSSGPPDVDALHSSLSGWAEQLDLRGGAYAGLVLEPGDPAAGWRVAAGDVMQRIGVAPDMEIGVPVGAFTQVNGELNRALVSAVVDASAGGGDRRVVDLYCGAGNFSLPLARAGAHVVGLDVDEVAIAAATASAVSLGLADRARFEVGVADDRALARLTEGPDVVVLDPPRAGAAAVLPAVLALRPPVLVYVSCDVATFGRDARAILAAGWSFSSLRLIDLTPQTYRAEVLGVFRLTW